MRSRRSVLFVVFDGVKMLDVTGPAEVFSAANDRGADYAIAYASPSGAPVTTSVGVTLSVGSAAADVDAHTVVVCGGDHLPTAVPEDLVAAVVDLAPRCERLVSICTGSFALAAAGVLARHRATTHWRHTAELARRYPDIAVQPDALFVEDVGIFTSAGVSAGIDLALALVERDHGRDVARAVARDLVVFMQRPGGQSQFSAPLEMRPPSTPELKAVVDLVAAQPELDHSVDAMAARVGVGARHLARLFAAELHITPARFVEQVRMDHAKSLLDRGYGVGEAARSAGFGSSETMRRVFVARLGIPPSEYRARFQTTGRDEDVD